MPTIALAHETDWSGWRRAARACVLAGLAPADLTWTIGARAAEPPAVDGGFAVPRTLLDIAALAFQAREPERFGLLYALVWQTHRGALAADDPDLRLARRWALAVRADAHRMRTQIRYAAGPGGQWIGWFEPAHFVLESTARLIARRAPSQSVTIATPDGTAHWQGAALCFGAGLTHPGDDETLLAWWESHRDAILAASHAGGGLPAAEDLDDAPRPLDRPPLGPVVLPDSQTGGGRRLAHDAAACTRCALHAPATQTVFGEGPAGARAMFIGEQPGDQEDVIGRPFVGPAGQLLDTALEEAGIDRREIYITNAVKHFKFEPRGKRRIHQSPSPEEIGVCRFWLDAERAAVNPALIVLLGGSAGRAVLGRPVGVTRERGRVFDLPDGTKAFLTVHPSYVLRQPDDASYQREYAAFLADLRGVKAAISFLSE